MTQQPMRQWSVITQGAASWSVVAEGDEATMRDVVNLYHSKRPSADSKVRLIDPDGQWVKVTTYGKTTLTDALPAQP